MFLCATCVHLVLVHNTLLNTNYGHQPADQIELKKLRFRTNVVVGEVEQRAQVPLKK